MNEILLHLRIDLLRLRWWLLLWFLLAVFLGRFDLAGTEIPLPAGRFWVTGIFVFALLLVRQHNLPGDGTWWVTRPASRRALALSKVLGMGIVALLWLAGRTIHLVLEGFDPLAAVLHQGEVLPLLVAVCLAVYLGISLSKSWQGLLVLLVGGLIVTSLLILSFQQWRDNWTMEVRKEVIARASVDLSLTEEERRAVLISSERAATERFQGSFLRWIDWRAEAGFLGGIFLSCGLAWALVRRFRARGRRFRPLVDALLVLAGASVAKAALLPEPLPRLEAELPPLVSPHRAFRFALDEEGGRVSMVRKEPSEFWNAPGLPSPILELPLTLLDPHLLLPEEAGIVPQSFGAWKRGMLPREEKPFAIVSPAFGFGHVGAAWKAFGFWEEAGEGDRPLIRFPLPPEFTIPRISVGIVPETEEPWAEVSRAEAWGRGILEPKMVLTGGIHRFSIQQIEVFQGPKERFVTWVARSSLDSLRFRLHRNPAHRRFGGRSSERWVAFLVDAEGRPVPGAFHTLGHHEDYPWAWLAFDLPEERADETFEIALARFLPVGKRAVEIEMPAEISVPAREVESP